MKEGELIGICLALLELVSLDEGEAVAVEHAVDIDEEQAFLRAAEEDLALKQLAQASAVSTVV